MTRLRRRALAALGALLLASSALAADLVAVDAAYALRSEGRSGEHAALEAARFAVRAAETAAKAAPDDIALRWREVRALHYLGELATHGERAQREVFARAMARGEDALARLTSRVGAARLDALSPQARRAQLARAGVAAQDAGELYFWSAVAVGAWSEKTGLLDAVRGGVTDRLDRYTRVAIDLAPNAYDGGPYRLWARMHTILPRVPLLTSWVDRKLALPAAERALAIAPQHPGNQVLLAMTLQDLAPARAGEAHAILERVASLTPRAGFEVEDEAVKRLARERLAKAARGS
ncbi:MAG: hypothetical protein FJ091_15375 [Deltaproteobacteria bacterium]|nr:hypothetical protein [Deltaproteobacteria bacterium]